MSLTSKFAGPLVGDDADSSALKRKRVARKPATGKYVTKKRATERVFFRVDEEFKTALSRAAALTGLDESKFSRQAIEREIEEVISQEMSMTLPNQDFDELMAMLDESIPVSPPMREAADRVDSGRKDIDEIRAALKRARQS